MILTSMLRLVTFGGLAVESRDGAAPPRPRPQRLAILAVLASAGDRGISRERMSALFWPDMDDEHARAWGLSHGDREISGSRRRE